MNNSLLRVEQLYIVLYEELYPFCEQLPVTLNSCFTLERLLTEYCYRGINRGITVDVLYISEMGMSLYVF